VSNQRARFILIHTDMARIIQGCCYCLPSVFTDPIAT
jgi:hypothetical protein